MGIILHKLYHRKDRKILLLGLESSGKTSILHILQKLTKKPPYTPLTYPTKGFNTDSIYFNNLNLVIWDLSGDEGMREYWGCYFTDVKAVVYCIDNSDNVSFEKSLDVLKKLTQVLDCAFLVFLTKKDIKSDNIEYCDKAIQVNKVMKRGLCAKVSMYDAIGIKDSFWWLTNQI